jgi:hypothetical protein
MVPAVKPGNRTPRLRPGEKFIKGPIPLAWVQAAAMLPGKALAVGMHVWYVAGRRKAATVPLNLSRLGMTQPTASRALRALESSGLLSVDRRSGRPPLVTILPAPGPSVEDWS